MGRILIGISAWADRSLIESGFYPEEVKTPADRLRYYSERFQVAEIDASYHFFPTRQNLNLWLDNTPPGFVFDIKSFSLFTRHPTPFNSLPRGFREKYGELIPQKSSIYSHHLTPEAVDELWQGFARIVQVIKSAGKLGVVLFQYPPWFHPRQENYDYIAECRRRLAQFQLAVEFRVGDWMDDNTRERTLTFLRDHGLALVCVDEPQGLKSSVPPLAGVTALVGFVRFHGRNGDKWESKDATDEKFRYQYNEAELKEWLPGIRDMAQKTTELHIIFKNKYRDFPVINANQFRKMLDNPASSG